VLAGPDVAVAGDVNVDILMRVKRLPEEDISVTAEYAAIAHGGVGGNIATALSRLGLRVALVGAVGRDVLGDIALRELEGEGVDTSLVERVSGVSTGIIAVFVREGGLRSIVGYRGANAYAPLTDKCLGLARRCRYLHASGYMMLNRDGGRLVVELLKASRDEGVATSIDLEGVAVERPDRIPLVAGLARYVFLNVDEARYAASTDDLGVAVRRLFKVLRPEALFVKAGGEGSIVATSPGDLVRVEAFRVEAIDSTGAGDAFNAGVIYGVLNGLSPVEAALLGNAMGAYSCLGWGARHLPRGLRELGDVVKGVKPLIDRLVGAG